MQVVAINANPAITPPSGYTPLLDVPNAFNTTKLFVCYRFAVAGVATWVGWDLHLDDVDVTERGLPG